MDNKGEFISYTHNAINCVASGLSLSDGIAILISIISLILTLILWLSENRPIVVAEIISEAGGNLAVPLSMVIHNVGNRTARDIQLYALQNDIDSIMNANITDVTKEDVRRCFSTTACIVALAPGEKRKNAFSCIKKESSPLKNNSRLPIRIKYKGLRWPVVYTEKLDLIIKDVSCFAGSGWKKKL